MTRGTVRTLGLLALGSPGGVADQTDWVDADPSMDEIDITNQGAAAGLDPLRALLLDPTTPSYQSAVEWDS